MRKIGALACAASKFAGLIAVSFPGMSTSNPVHFFFIKVRLPRMRQATTKQLFQVELHER
jgi:hypothetical protein